MKELLITKTPLNARQIVEQWAADRNLNIVNFFYGEYTTRTLSMDSLIELVQIASAREKGNTPIEELIAQYTEENCDFTDIEWVKKAALRYVETMADSQVRCLLYTLASKL